MKAKSIALTLSLLLLSGLLLVTYAQTETAGSPQDDCQASGKIISAKIKDFQAIHPEHSLKFQILYLKVAAYARKADVLGYNTTKLYQNLDELEKQLDKFEANHKILLESLGKTAKITCGKEDVYARSYVTAMAALSEVKKSAESINSLYEDKIRPNILSLEKYNDN